MQLCFTTHDLPLQAAIFSHVIRYVEIRSEGCYHIPPRPCSGEHAQPNSFLKKGYFKSLGGVLIEISQGEYIYHKIYIFFFILTQFIQWQDPTYDDSKILLTAPY